MMNKKIMHNLSRSIPDFVETEVEACCNKLMQDMVVRVATEVDMKVLMQRCIRCGLLKQARLMLSIADIDACCQDTCIRPPVSK